MSGHVAGAWILRHQVPETLERRPAPDRPRPAHRAPDREPVVLMVLRGIFAPAFRRRARA
jgi:hypothetical protein